MLRTYKAGGTKQKTIGDAALNLRRVPIFGRTLKADRTDAVFQQVLEQNNLCLVAFHDTFKFTQPTSITNALNKYGPIMIGGMYGRLFGKKMGHFIILSGIDTERQIVLINDPDKGKEDWRTYERVRKDYWGTLYTDDLSNAIAVKP